MSKKILVIISFVITPLVCYSQHLDFYNISMGNNLASFEKYLLQNGAQKDYCLDLGAQYDNQIDKRYYKYIKQDIEYKLIVCYTRFSNSVYSVYVFSQYSDIALCKEKYNELIGKTISDNSFTIKDKGTQFIKLENELGTVFIAYDGTSVHISYTDHENDLLRQAVTFTFSLNKRACRRLQKKYNNPYFYDKNPRFSF